MTYNLVAADTLNTQRIDDLRAIYESAYAAVERAPWTSVRAYATSTEDVLALVHGDAPVGFALLRGLADTHTVFLRYFAIDPAQRGHGLGAHFWQLLIAHARGRGYRQLVWDVAAPDEPTIETTEHDVRLRRIGCVERAGGSLVPLGEYGDASDPDPPLTSVPMRLVATSLRHGTDPMDARALGRLALDVYAYRSELAIEAADSRTSLDSIPDYDP